MVDKMPASEYIRFLKSARMLFAEKRLAEIENISFPHFKTNEHRDSVMRAISRASREFIVEGMTDFADFAKSMAQRLMIGGTNG